MEYFNFLWVISLFYLLFTYSSFIILLWQYHIKPPGFALGGKDGVLWAFFQNYSGKPPGPVGRRLPSETV